MKRKSKAEKRVEIAKDVLAQLRAEKIVASQGTYCFLDADIQGTEELREEVKGARCEVCALGALFMGDIRKNDKCKGVDVGLGLEPDGFVNHYIDERAMRDRLGKLFSVKQTALIECAFEKGIDPTNSLSENEYATATAFGNRYEDSSERLRVIMRNIIRNDGQFKLPKKLVAKHG